MKFGLIIAGFADVKLSSNQRAAWSNFLPEAEDIATKHAQIERIVQGVWLIPLDSSYSALAKLVALADDWKVPSRTLLFEQRPPFLENAL